MKSLLSETPLASVGQSTECTANYTAHTEEQTFLVEMGKEGCQALVKPTNDKNVDVYLKPESVSSQC
ncbi:unnamed protein product [Echinostoma caproni]|uniref:Signal peptide protein n=1 Tax=Echinostoma caproni TaxID=27848 RepID=A0A183AR54_9TREM|nr:unnamed protein product [Echinostoma caproni]